jgi:hypothetical protein
MLRKLRFLMTDDNPEPLSTPDCRHGLFSSPGARFLDFTDWGSTPAAHKEQRWNFYTRIVPVSMCIRTP